MDVLLQDVRYALRSLRRSPGYTAVVVAVMALGIGVNAMVFNMVYGILYRPLPLPEPGRLAVVQQRDVRRNENFEVSFMNLRDFRRQMKTVEGVGGGWNMNAMVTLGRDPERLFGGTVTTDLFDVLGVKPVIGHGFTPDEEVWNKNWSSVLISYRIWKSRFHGETSVLGQPLRINGRTRTIIGVMPPGFLWSENQDFWIPCGFNPDDERRNSYALLAAARLKPGVTFAQADAEARTIMARIARDDPKTSQGISARVVPLKEGFVESLRPMMLLLQGAVAFVLLIACANVANLMLARAAGRRREIGMRLALGASRGRIMRQLLTESVVISVFGAGLGILLANWGQKAWLSMIPPELELPMWLDFRMDVPALLFTAGISVVSGLLFGFAPALHAADGRLSEALREGSTQAGSSRGRNRLRAGLVVAEVALSLVLLVGAGLMLRSFVKRYDQEKGLRLDGITTANVLLPFATYPKDEQKIQFFHTLLPQIAALPGVEEATGASTLPLGRNGDSRDVWSEDMKTLDPKVAVRSRYACVFPGFFHALGIPLQAGRDFGSFDTHTSQRVAIVSASLARKLWPKQSPLGKRLRFVGEPDSLGWATVVGQVADVLQNVEDPHQRFEGVYTPHDQDGSQWMALVVSSRGDSGPLAARIRDLLRSHDPDLPLIDVRTMHEHIRFSMWTHRLFLSLFIAFAALALVIAAVGIYGVMSYSIGQRTQEIGVRIALGAEPAAVVRMVTLQALKLTAFGIGFGLAGAWAVTRLMAAQLFEVSPTDPPTYVVVGVLLALSGVVAAWLPALRAARVDPMVALRYE
jgi:putative ABC transport system permease protein